MGQLGDQAPGRTLPDRSAALSGNAVFPHPLPGPDAAQRGSFPGFSGSSISTLPVPGAYFRMFKPRPGTRVRGGFAVPGASPRRGLMRDVHPWVRRQGAARHRVLQLPGCIPREARKEPRAMSLQSPRSDRREGRAQPPRRNIRRAPACRAGTAPGLRRPTKTN